MNGRRAILNAEEARVFSEKMKSIDWVNDKKARVAFATVIVDELREDIVRDDVIGMLGVDVRTYQEGQSLEFTTHGKTLKAYVHEPGSFAPRSRIVNKSVTLTAELVSVNTELEIGELKSGRYGSVEDIRREALETLQGRKYGIVWSTLVGSVATTDANYWSVAAADSAAAKKAALESGLQYVLDQQGSTAVAIVGRRNALGFLGDYSAYNTYGPSEAKKAELDTNPYPASYKGIPVVYLNQYKDGWNGSVISEGNIMIVGSDTIKMGVERELDFAEDFNSNTLVWNVHMYEKYGVAVLRPTRNARIAIT